MSKLAEGTIELYEKAYRHFIRDNKDISTIPTNKVTSKTIQLLYNELLLNGVKIAQIKNLYKFLTRFCHYAHSEGYCSDFMAAVELPNMTGEDEENDDQIIVFATDELETILQNRCEAGRLQFLYVLASSSGMRQGELLAVKYTDFINGGVKVTNQYKRTIKIKPDGSRKNIKKIAKTKNKKSRFIPLPKIVLEELESHKKWHEAEMQEMGYKTDYVFTTVTGNLLDKSNLRRAYMAFLKRINIDFKKFHAFRSTYCTTLCEQGVKIKIASEFMGHSSILVMKKYYLFVSEASKTSEIEKVNPLFNRFLMG